MTADWMPVIVGALTAATTLTGVAITQWRSDRREAAHAQLEASREKVRQSREDLARVFEYRRDAYLSFLSGARSSLDGWAAFEYLTPDQDPPDDALEELWNLLTIVKVYGTPAASSIAQEIYDWLIVDIFRPESKTDDHAGGFLRLSGEFLAQIRGDLGISHSQEVERRQSTD